MCTCKSGCRVTCTIKVMVVNLDASTTLLSKRSKLVSASQSASKWDGHWSGLALSPTVKGQTCCCCPVSACTLAHAF